MLNKKLLESKMKLFGDRQEDLAKYLEISTARCNAKINETDGAKFTQPEMTKIRERYNLTDEEFLGIFFNEDVS